MVDFDKGREDRLRENMRTGGSAECGVTVRDYFAAKAMQALLSREDAPKEVGEDWFAIFSYEMADAMMVEREKLHVNVRGQVSVEEAFGLEK